MDFIKKYKNIIPIALIALALLLPQLQKVDWKKYIPNFGGGSSVVEIINFETVDEPTQEFKDMADGISELIKGEDAKLDSMVISQFYSQLSKIVRNSEKLRTKKQFREYYNTVGQINYSGLSMRGKYEGLNKKVDGAIQKAIGLKNDSFTVESKERLADILAAISWEIYHPEQ